MLVQCWSSVAGHCCFNANKLSTTLAQHYSNTGYAVCLAAAPQQTRAIYSIMFQCWSNVFAAGPKLKQHWVIVPCLLGLLCGWCFPPPVARKATTRKTHTLTQYPSSPHDALKHNFTSLKTGVNSLQLGVSEWKFLWNWFRIHCNFLNFFTHFKSSSSTTSR